MSPMRGKAVTARKTRKKPQPKPIVPLCICTTCGCLVHAGKRCWEHPLHAVAVMHQPPIEIDVLNGTITEIRNLPEGLVIEVNDYDLGITCMKDRRFSHPVKGKHIRERFYMMRTSIHYATSLHREALHHAPNPEPE